MLVKNALSRKKAILNLIFSEGCTVCMKWLLCKLLFFSFNFDFEPFVSF